MIIQISDFWKILCLSQIEVESEIYNIRPPTNLCNLQSDLELQQNEEALQIYSALKDAGLNNCTYIMAQIAIALHNLRRVSPGNVCRGGVPL